MTYPTPEQLDEIINGPHTEMTEDDWDELLGINDDMPEHDIIPGEQHLAESAAILEWMKKQKGE